MGLLDELGAANGMLGGGDQGLAAGVQGGPVGVILQMLQSRPVGRHCLQFRAGWRGRCSAVLSRDGRTQPVSPGHVRIALDADAVVNVALRLGVAHEEAAATCRNTCSRSWSILARHPSVQSCPFSFWPLWGGGNFLLPARSTSRVAASKSLWWVRILSCANHCRADSARIHSASTLDHTGPASPLGRGVDAILPSNTPPCVIKAQATRALRFASATAATRTGLRRSSRSSHGSDLLLRHLIADIAPSTSSRLRYPSPRLLMPPRDKRLPLART